MSNSLPATYDLNHYTQIATAWMNADPDPETRAETRQLIERADLDLLAEHFGARLAFGTAGLRGALGAGPNRMNRALVRRVSFGLALYLHTRGEHAEGLSTETGHAQAHRPQRIVIGYDGRHGSLPFAHESAEAFCSMGFEVYLAPTVCPTPLLAYAVIALECMAGVMVTASHNPPQDNGFKVYWSDGAQIIPPHDSGISASIDEVGDCADRLTVPVDVLRARGQLYSIPESVGQGYLSDVLHARAYGQIERSNADALSALPAQPGVSDLRIVYTAMHGVGAQWFHRVLNACGYTQLFAVPEQSDPDPDFPTVSFPNPEEPGALDLAKALAKEREAHVVLAHDPDADRLAVVARDSSGIYRAFTGDQIGALIAHELFGLCQPNAHDMVATTIVSSSLLSAMAHENGVTYGETLTGFKWIANRALAHRAEGGRFLFGYEEAIGYSLYEVVRDKDGISAALCLADIAARALSEGKTLWDRIEEVYRRYGLYLSTQRNRVLPGAEGAAEIRGYMSALRATPPEVLGGVKVVECTDLSLDDGALKGDVLRFRLADGARVIARPSGTEPKIKFYFEVKVTLESTDDAPLKEAQTRGDTRLKALIKDFEALLS